MSISLQMSPKTTGNFYDPNWVPILLSSQPFGLVVPFGCGTGTSGIFAFSTKLPPLISISLSLPIAITSDKEHGFTGSYKIYLLRKFIFSLFALGPCGYGCFFVLPPIKPKCLNNKINLKCKWNKENPCLLFFAKKVITWFPHLYTPFLLNKDKT